MIITKLYHYVWHQLPFFYNKTNMNKNNNNKIIIIIIIIMKKAPR